MEKSEQEEGCNSSLTVPYQFPFCWYHTSGGLWGSQKDFPITSNCHHLSCPKDGTEIKEFWCVDHSKPKEIKAERYQRVQVLFEPEKNRKPSQRDLASSEHSLFSFVNLSKSYLLLAFQQARFIKGEMSILGLAPPCPRSAGNQSGHSSKWHFAIIRAYMKLIWEVIYVDKH